MSRVLKYLRKPLPLLGEPKMDSNSKNNNALEIALRYASSEGIASKDWCIDQMVRALLGGHSESNRIEAFSMKKTPAYEQFVKEFNAGETGPNTHTWQEGIKP